MVPVLAIVTVVLAYSALTAVPLPEMMAAEKEATLTVGAGISAIVGAIIIGAIILPDITRLRQKLARRDGRHIHFLHDCPTCGHGGGQPGRCGDGVA